MFFFIILGPGRILFFTVKMDRSRPLLTLFAMSISLYSVNFSLDSLLFRLCFFLMCVRLDSDSSGIGFSDMLKFYL